MWVARMTTENFEFTAVGNDFEAATQRLADGFERHLKETGSSRSQWCSDTGSTAVSFVDGLNEWYGIHVGDFTDETTVLRDGVPIA